MTDRENAARKGATGAKVLEESVHRCEIGGRPVSERARVRGVHLAAGQDSAKGETGEQEPPLAGVLEANHRISLDPVALAFIA
ncbi:MAG TPA: hypothetical protein VGX68_28500 [Thermoanaerobaculia bacterium]|jgi:hypothetical protein|nr:hypothetical protein [Thermoanaerobaculia bacterium]